MFIRIANVSVQRKYYLEYINYEKLRLSFLFSSLLCDSFNKGFKSVEICTNQGTKNAFLTATQFRLTQKYTLDSSLDMTFSPFFQYSLLDLPTITKSSGSRGMDWLQTAVLQKSPLTTALQRKTGPCQHSLHILMEICGFSMDPKISTCYGFRQPLKPI